MCRFTIKLIPALVNEMIDGICSIVVEDRASAITNSFNLFWKTQVTITETLNMQWH